MFESDPKEVCGELESSRGAVSAEVLGWDSLEWRRNGEKGSCD